MGALVYPFFQNSFAKIATLWFGEQERTTAATLGAMAYGGGTLLGLTVGPFFVLDSDEQPEHHEAGREHVRMLMFVTALLVTVICLPTLFIFRQAPKVFPSPSAEQAAHKLKEKAAEDLDTTIEEIAVSSWAEFKTLMRNTNFILLMVSFSMQTTG